MLHRSRDRRQREGAFTLIELLIVIVILGVLAAVVILAIGAFNNRGELAACQADVKAVEVAVEAYRANEERYPDSLNDLTAAPGNYLREVPNTAAGTGEYWILYEPQTGTVEGRLKDNSVCAGALATLTPGPSGTTTTPGGGGGPGGGSPTTTTTTPGGGNPTTTTTSPGGGVAQPPNFPLTIQPETMVSQDLRDIIPACGDWGDFLGGGSQEYLTTWTSNGFTIPQGFSGTYRVTVHVDSNQSVNGLRLRYRSGSGSWSTAATWNVGNGCDQSFTADITFTGSSSPKQIRLDNQNWGNRWLLLDSVQITRIA